MIGHLRESDAERGRQSANRARRKRNHRKRPYRTPEPGMVLAKRCQCEKPWHGGEGSCVRCGKPLAGVGIR